MCNRVAIMDHGRIIAAGSPRDLVTEHIEPQVIEVFGDGAEAWAASHGARLSERSEQTGETVFCYAHHAEPLLHDLELRPELRYLHRPANLEDVFLRLTGRDLRD
jgi:lipooligosaccharide transport system ATP-binding protein